MTIRAGSGRVAVTGASGLLGSKLAFRLAAEGAPQRLVVRDEERAPSLGDGPLPESEVAVVGGYSDTRAMVEAFGGFVLVHVSTPLSVCESRDPKGLYARARAGLLKTFTGVSDPYEKPADADITLDTSSMSPNDAAEMIIRLLRERGYL